jgi:hypothetical protein
MKVLGTTSGGFIVEMRTEEINKIRGYSNNYSKGYREAVVGYEYNVSTAWERLENIRVRRDVLKKLSDELRTYADVLIWKEEVINGVLKKDEEGNDG